MSPFRPLLGLFLAALTTGAAAQGLECRAPAQPMMVGELLFGRNIDGRLGVTETQWRQFLAGEVTPRFPDGLTVLDAAGQWRDQKSNRVVRERSKVVMIIMPADAAAQERIDAIVAAYKRRFRQQSVGVVLRPACVAF